MWAQALGESCDVSFDGSSLIMTLHRIWLKRLSSWSKHLPGASPCYLHGFDISSDQFPAEPGDVNFTIHDITKPFPSEHLGRYDIVHLRLFVLALPESDMVKALTNVIGLLRKFC